MTRDEWQKSLASLRAEAETLDPDSARDRQRLDRLAADIEHHLENPGDAEHKTTVLEGLSSAVEHFEAEHPRLTVALNQLMMKLSSMGI